MPISCQQTTKIYKMQALKRTSLARTPLLFSSFARVYLESVLQSTALLSFPKGPKNLPPAPCLLVPPSPPDLIGSLPFSVYRSLFPGYGVQGDVGLPGDHGQPMINGIVELLGYPKGDKGMQVCWEKQLAVNDCGVLVLKFCHSLSHFINNSIVCCCVPSGPHWGFF